MKTTEVVKIFLLGMITASLLVIAINPRGQLSLAGTASTSKKGDIIAVTGSSKGSNDELLFLVDTVNHYVVQYGQKGDGKFRLFGARYFGDDLRIRDLYNRNGITLKEAEKQVKKEKDEKDAKIGELAAVSGENGTFFLIDTTRRFMAQYRVDNSRRFLFQTARYIKNDLYIKELPRKLMNAGLSVDEAKKQARKWMNDDS